MTPKRPVKIYRNVLCRFLELDYVGTKTMEYGGKGLEYKVSNKSYSLIPENKCLCPKGTCLEGVSDLAPCLYGLPVVLSNAHFLDADPSVYERVEGMNPSEELHGSEFIIEPIIGLVLTTRFSVQLNVLVSDVTFNSNIQRYSNMPVPIAYFKIVQPKLPADQITSVRLMHVYGPYLLIALQFILVSSTVFLISHPLRLIYWNWVTSRRKTIESDVLNVKDVPTTEPLIEGCEKT
ncbi:scavenger receptor class B member 1-like [Trichoplusia ni]|uniref:Scavenger receptor class B member 1-like n=1 Tax=Trichoplusia ni TaxID=7111 RepID=A0A7E5X1B2_TRINI|nr:scavenger receptor class B member 1-like [Trichoplusia ni]